MVAIGHAQAGNLTPFGGYQPRIQDNFNLGPTLVRGFSPGGIGPRDNNWLAWNSNTNYGNALGGTNYWGAAAEVQFPVWGLPKDLGLRAAGFVDAGSLWDYQGRTNYSNNNWPTIPGLTCIAPYSAQAGYGQGTCVVPQSQNMIVRASAGASILWNSPMGPLRFDYAIPFAKAKTDITQYFRFSGGTNF